MSSADDVSPIGPQIAALTVAPKHASRGPSVHHLKASDKRPATAHGYLDAVTDPDAIAALLELDQLTAQRPAA